MSAITALRTLDGIEDGTDIAVMQNSRVTRYKALGGGLVRDGSTKPLDAWFFAGLIKEGAVMLGDFSPPEPGEWWGQHSSAYGHLVLSREGVKTTTMMFRRGVFYEWRLDRNLLDEGYVRIEKPAWVSPEYYALAQVAWRTEQAKRGAETRANAIADARYNLTYAKDYLDRAVTLMEGRSR